MKRFALSALVCTALACPGLADDQLFVVECPAGPETPIAEVEVDVPEVEDPVIDAEITPAFDPDVTEVIKDVDVAVEDLVDVTAVIDDSVIITTMSETQRTDVDDPSIIYFSTTSTGAETTTDASTSVNQLADEQRNSLRLFSGRDAGAENAGKAANLKDLFAARATLKTETTGQASTKLGTAERDAARQKAEIDQLRDKAMRTRDSRLMSQADAMAAAQARRNSKARTFLGFSFGRK
jgi:hypothetical protein